MNKYLFFTKAILLQSLKLILGLLVIVVVESVMLVIILKIDFISFFLSAVLPLLIIFFLLLILNYLSSLSFLKPRFVYNPREDILKASKIWDFQNGQLLADDNDPPIQFPVSYINLPISKNIVGKKKGLMILLPFALVKQYSSSGIRSFFNSSKIFLPKELAELDVVRLPHAGLRLQDNQPYGDLFLLIRPISTLKYYLALLFDVLIILGVLFIYIQYIMGIPLI